jgi:CDP-glucose 4,6-dehydratase
VTGHTGFKGAWLCLWLRRLGAEVAGLSLNPPSRPSLFEILGLESGLLHMRGDIRDTGTVRRAVADHRPELVLHLAAQALVRPSFADPVQTFAANVMGTVNLLEACRQNDGVRAVVNITSDKCYENREWVWGYRENDPMGGHDPYSASKGCAELVAASYQRSFFAAQGPALASARAGNVIGGGDFGCDRLVPDCIRALAAGCPVAIRRPEAVRPWQHVLEPLSGYLLLAARLLETDASGGLTREFAGGWNFGPAGHNTLTVGQVAGRVVALWGGGQIVADPGPHPHEAHFLSLDCSKAARLLGWQARWSPETALEQTVAWYRLHHQGAGAEALAALMHGQIDAYGAATDADGQDHEQHG